MKKIVTRCVAGALLCMLLVTSALAAIGPLAVTAASCSGSLYLGNDVPEYEKRPYDCSIGHTNCTVQPLLYETIGSSTEKYHFHAAYHSSLGYAIPCCTY